MATTRKPMTTTASVAVDISVLVPVKDEVDSLAELAAQVTEALTARKADEVAGSEWEMILIDDGSTDGSWDEIVRLAESNPRVRGVRLRRNFGKSLALRAGLDVSTGAIIVTLDGDLQDDPAEIADMVARLAEPADFVAGHKAKRLDPLGKRLPSKLFNAVTGAVTGLKLRDHNCGLKVIRREAIESVPLYGEMHRFIAAIAHAQGFKVVEQSVHHRARIHGKSKFGLERYARGALDLLTVVTLTRYNRRPAHLFGGFGIFIGLVGFGVLAYLSVLWAFFDQSIGDRPLLIMGVLFMVLAVQLTSVGLIAEMLVSRDSRGENPRGQVRELANVAA